MSRVARISAFALIAFTVLWGVFALAGTVLAPWLGHSPLGYQIAAFVYVAFVFAAQTRIFGGAPSDRSTAVLSWASNLAMGAGSTLVLYVLLTFVLSLPLPDSYDRARGFMVIALTLITCLVGFFQAWRGPRIVEIDIPIADLPSSLEGLRIAQISDLHVSHTIGRGYVERVVTRTQGLGADLIVMTGDFVDGTVDSLRHKIAPLGTLSARLGKFFITGNHEYYWGVDAWVAEHERLGARVLINEHVVLREADATLVLAGVTDHRAGSIRPGHESDPRAALAGAPIDALRVLLAHQPVSHRAASGEGIHLQLSGHTHGGQWFPASLLVRLAQRHLRGLHRVGDSWLYVSPGTGYWGPPLRFLVSSEITLLTLRAKTD